jgi:hypothetical protein
LNVTTLTGNDLTWLEYDEGFVRQPQYRLGGHAGLGMSLGFGRHGNSSLAIDVLFSMKGANYFYDQYYYANETDTVTTHLEVRESVTRLCVDVPIVYRYRANMGLYGEAGIYVSFAAATIFKSDEPRYSDPDFDYLAIEESQYKPLDIGFTAGAGWIGEGGFGVGLRAFMGMLDQYDTYGDFFGVLGLAAPSGRTVNFGYQLSGMYYFNWYSRGGRRR